MVEASTPKRRSRLFRARCAVPLLLASGLAGCFDKTEKVAAPVAPRPVQVATIAYEAHRATRSFSGVIQARIETNLGFRVDGKVLKRLVNIGDPVEPGQMIAALDDTDLKLQLQSAEAELSAARSSLAQAQADMGRTSTLAQKGWAAGSSLDKQKAARDEAVGRLAKAERAVDIARDQLSYVALRAEAKGVVTAVSVEAGQVVKTGDPAIRIARLDEREAVVAIPEAFVGRVRNAAAGVELWSDPGHVLPAHLRELSPIADAGTRTFAARFSIPGAGDGVALGMTATVTLTEGDAQRLAKIPLSAVYDTGHGAALWVVGGDGGLTLRPVVVAAYGGDGALVRAGVADGDRVVSLGVQKLDAGQHVRIVAAID